MGEVVPKMAQQHLLWVLLACLVQGGHLTVNSTLLTIGSQPNSYNITAGEMMYFRIDIVNDYCNKASVSALSACGQPAAVLRLENCNGETWLYANPYSLAEPTRTSYDMRSKNASIQGDTEELSFTLSQANTYIGVWGVTDAIFQIWVSDVNFNATTVPRVSPILASGTNETMRGFLHTQSNTRIRYSNRAHWRSRTVRGTSPTVRPMQSLTACISCGLVMQAMRIGQRTCTTPPIAWQLRVLFYTKGLWCRRRLQPATRTLWI